MMSGLGMFGVFAVATVVLVVCVLMILRAGRDPAQTKSDPGELKRGPVSGGAIRGDAGQVGLTGEAPRQDADRETSGE